MPHLVLNLNCRVCGHCAHSHLKMADIWSPPVDASAASDHYELLGVSPASGAEVTPVQRVLQLAAVSSDSIKDCYKQTLRHFSGNPFSLSKLSQAFSVLSNDQSRRLYDLGLMQKAAEAATRTVLYFASFNLF